MIRLDSDEKIKMKARKHWFVFLGETFFLLLLALLPFGVLIAYKALELSRFIASEGATFLLGSALAVAWFIFLWTTFFVLWTDYFLDVLVLTNKRVIDIEQKGLFSRDVSTISLEQIQDITVSVNGIIPTLLDFGDLRLQSAGAEREFIIRSIAHPYETRGGLLDAIAKKKEG